MQRGDSHRTYHQWAKSFAQGDVGDEQSECGRGKGRSFVDSYGNEDTDLCRHDVEVALLKAGGLMRILVKERPETGRNPSEITDVELRTLQTVGIGSDVHRCSPSVLPLLFWS